MPKGRYMWWSPEGIITCVGLTSALSVTILGPSAPTSYHQQCYFTIYQRPNTYSIHPAAQHMEHRMGLSDKLLHPYAGPALVLVDRFEAARVDIIASIFKYYWPITNIGPPGDPQPPHQEHHQRDPKVMWLGPKISAIAGLMFLVENHTESHFVWFAFTQEI